MSTDISRYKQLVDELAGIMLEQAGDSAYAIEERTASKLIMGNNARDLLLDIEEALFCKIHAVNK